MKTYTRTREQGTQETIAGNPQDRLAVLRRIVANKQYEKLDGTMIDLLTASAIVAVYDALETEESKSKFSSFPAGKMGLIAFKLLKA